jgi:multidrug resistance efflux pump
MMRGVVFSAGSALAGWFAAGAFQNVAQPTAQAAAAPESTGRAVLLAAPGRTEGVSEAVNVAAGIDGVLSAVVVDEGQPVRAGDVIATVDRRELAAELEHARAAAESARQAKARLLRGSREEERRQAAAEVARTSASLEQAKLHHARQARLLETDDVPRAAADRARSDMEVAAAAHRAATEREKLVNAPPLPEELARAESEIRAADERIRTIEATIAKCTVRSPVDGTIVRRYMRPGEVVSVVFPQPIVSIVDDSRLRVRAEVDERDLGRIRVGQNVLVSADSLASGKLPGRVSSLASTMGRKRVRTGDPAEKSDRDVLEVLVDVEEKDPRLVLGLRVTVQFLDGESRAHAKISAAAAKRRTPNSHNPL